MSSTKLERSLLLVMGVLFVALGYVVVDAFRDKVVDVGDKAPDFQITADNGRVLSRSGFGGRLLVLNFWATWCPPCIEEMPSLDQFQRRFAASGVVVAGVSVDTNERTYHEFLRKANVSFLTVRDPEARISSSYGTFKYPETYVIDSQGKVVRKIIGPADWMDAKMVSYIQSLL
ncbi:MAG: TlpA family protein disulfide reductase [Acidobacteriales bacterium]|nr:TlpA family protein disulfide reductase [Terriglobales bacterium]